VAGVLMGDAGILTTVDHTHPFAHAEPFIRRKRLNDGDSLTILHFNGDFDTGSASNALFNCSTRQTPSYRTNHSHNLAGFFTTDTAAGNAAYQCTCTTTNRCFGALDFNRPQLLDRSVFNPLNCSGLGATVALTGQARCASGESDLGK